MNFPQRTTTLPTATPKLYVILHNTQHCAHCSSIHESTTVMLKGDLPARHSDISGAKVTQMTTLKQAPQFDLPISIMRRPVERIPFCHECLGQNADGTTAVSHLPMPAVEDKRILSAAKASEASSAPKSTPKRTIRSVDDILSAL
jgi:hypothetical protein